MSCSDKVIRVKLHIRSATMDFISAKICGSVMCSFTSVAFHVAAQYLVAWV